MYFYSYKFKYLKYLKKHAIFFSKHSLFIYISIYMLMGKDDIGKGKIVGGLYGDQTDRQNGHTGKRGQK